MLQNQQREKIIRVSNAVAAGTTDVNCTGVDMANWESVEFVALVGTLTANQVTALHAQQSDDDGSSDAYSDLEGTGTDAFADAASNKVARLEVVRPRKRFVRCVVDRATANAVIDGVIAILRGPRTEPITQDASVPVYKSVVSPDEGTP